MGLTGPGSFVPWFVPQLDVKNDDSRSSSTESDLPIAPSEDTNAQDDIPTSFR